MSNAVSDATTVTAPAGTGENERHAGGFLPAGIFEKVFFLAHVAAIVAGEHDVGVVGVGAVFERGEDMSDLIVREGDAGEVGPEPAFEHLDAARSIT